MKRFILVMAVLAALLVSSCDLFTSKEATPEEVAAVMGLAGNSINTESTADSRSLAVGRAVDALVVAGEGDEGGSVSVTFALSDDLTSFTGTAVYSDFVVYNEGDEYVLNGQIDMTYDYDIVSDFDIDTMTGTMTVNAIQSMEGSIEVSKNGGAEVTFDVDLTIVLAVETVLEGEDHETTVSITVSGNVGAETVSVSENIAL